MDTNDPNQIKEWEEKLEAWLEHLQNLTFIKYETQLEKYDNLIESEEK